MLLCYVVVVFIICSKGKLYNNNKDRRETPPCAARERAEGRREMSNICENVLCGSCLTSVCGFVML